MSEGAQEKLAAALGDRMAARPAPTADELVDITVALWTLVAEAAGIVEWDADDPGSSNVRLTERGRQWVGVLR